MARADFRSVATEKLMLYGAPYGLLAISPTGEEISRVARFARSQTLKEEHYR
jgi:hypothetical protein